MVEPTEEHCEGLVGPPAEESEKWHPEEQELDAHVDRTCLGETLRGRRGVEAEVYLQRLADEKSDGNGSSG